jgi:hypothetical protein
MDYSERLMHAAIRIFSAIRKLGHVVSYGEAEGRPFPNLWERLVENR